MTREDAKKAAEVMLAYADGKEIECFDFNKGNPWLVVEDPSFNWVVRDYRIKPTPTYRPFANAEECWEEMKKHEPFGWVKSNVDDRYYTITCVGNENISIALNGGLSPDTVFERYTFADDSVFGKKDENPY